METHPFEPISALEMNPKLLILCIQEGISFRRHSEKPCALLGVLSGGVFGSIKMAWDDASTPESSSHVKPCLVQSEDFHEWGYPKMDGF